MHLTCEQCGNEFKPGRNRGTKQRFCSEECQRLWWKQHRDQKRRYIYICQNCGKEYTAKERNRNQCCSRECGWELRSKRAIVEKKCLSCGQVFEGRKSGSDYCSDECRQRGIERTCKVCGFTFYGYTGAVYCSRECELKFYREQFREHKKALGRNSGRIENIVCKECGKQFEHQVYNQIPEFCSHDCARQHWRRNNPENYRIMKAKEHHKRRANKYANGPIDTIDPMSVFARDGWVCGICGKKVKQHLKFPHPMSASLDHIRPLADGGTHTFDNVQLAHLLCNSLKGASGGGQLRLPVC